MKILVTGGSGTLGTDLIPILIKGGHNIYAPDEKELDITIDDSVAIAVKKIAPEIIIHCAAYTDVDGCEKDPKLAIKVNQAGTAALAYEARQAQAQLIYLSTDCVFSDEPSYLTGEQKCIGEDAITYPISAYGKSKEGGERFVQCWLRHNYMIIRTSWLFGKNGKCFPKTIIEAARAGKPLKVVCDQIGRPTYTQDLSQVILDLINKDAKGIFHVQNSGPEVSWFDFAKAILLQAGIGAQVESISTADWKKMHPDSAPRPSYSVFDLGKINRLGIAMRDWEDALSEYLSEIKNLKGGEIK